LKKLYLSIATLLSVCVHLLIYAFAYAAGVIGLVLAYRSFGFIGAAVALPLILIAMGFLIICELFLLRILIPRPRVGIHQQAKGAHFLYILNHGIFDMALEPVFPVLAAMFKTSNCCRILMLKACGAKIRFSARISRTARIHDPYLLTVGTDALIGEETRIFCSAVESSKILIYRTFIGPKASIGPSSLLFPGTEVGEGSVLGMGSSTRNEMKIPPYELWVGNPASHLARLSRPMLYTAMPEERREQPVDRRPFSRERGGRDRDRERGGRDRDFRRRDRGGYERGPRGDRGERGDRGGRFMRRPDFGPRPPRGPETRGPETEPQPIQPGAVSQPAVERPQPAPPIRRGDKPYIGPIDAEGRPESVTKPESGPSQETPSQQPPNSQ
jgi:hypothetical protein